MEERSVMRCITSIMIVVVTVRLCVCSQAEHDLYVDLMDGYSVLERPVSNVSKPVVVYLGIVLQQLIDVNEVEQTITMNVWLNYAWNDYHLAWDPTKYENISDVRFPSDQLWKPDVLLYNSVDSDFDSTYPTNLVLYSDGTVNWIPPGIFVVSCEIDITWFPFDEQKCHFKFGSWSFDGTKIDLQPGEKGFDMSEYLLNGEWSIEKTYVVRMERFYDCCPEPYPDLKFWMIMRRRTLYFGLNLIVPCILITLMCVLGFMLPPDAGEKITLQITVLLAVCVFLNMVTNMSPTTSEAVPLLGIFFSTCMVVVAAAVVTTVMVLNFHHTSPDFNEMGYTTRCILLYWLPWLLYMNRPGQKLGRKDLPNPFHEPKDDESESTGSVRSQNDVDDGVIDERQSLVTTTSEQTLLNEDNDIDEIDQRINECYKKMAERQVELQLDMHTQSRLYVMHRIYTQLKTITKRMRDEDDNKEKQNDWVYAAMVIDRFCMWLLSVFILMSTCFIMFKAPYLTVSLDDFKAAKAMA